MTQPPGMRHGDGAAGSWAADELTRIDAARELQIAARRGDGTLRPWTPVWVVCADGETYVRTWHRRDSGWYGQARRSRRARIRVPGLEADVSVQAVGERLRASVDAAYRDKYDGHGDGSVSGMVTDEAVASTLRLDPE